VRRQLSNMARKTLDQRVEQLKGVNLVAPNGGWIRAVREALGMTATQFAERADVTRQTAHQYEKNEIDGSIRIDTMRRAAEILECQFLYAFVPKTSFDEIVREQASKVAVNELARVDQTMLLENQRVDRREMEQRLTQRVEELIGSSQLWNARTFREL
jgi:predicted DNA-binding mobile mystery protein A